MSLFNLGLTARALSTNKRQAVLVTGSTDGIGVTTAKNMAAKGWDVLIHGRDSTRIEKAVRTVTSFASSRKSDGRIWALPPVDLSTVQGSEQLATAVDQLCDEENLSLRVLMNNAGVYSDDCVITEDGLELTLAVNVVAPFVLTSLLLPRLIQSANDEQGSSRIVIASSISQCRSIRDWDDFLYQDRRYSAHSSYAESKLLDAMLCMEFADRLRKDKQLDTKTITCNCLDPGTVNTKMLYAGWGPIGIPVEDALDQTWLCSSTEVEGVTGKYYVYQSERGSTSSYSQQERDRMWNWLSGIAPDAAGIWE